MSETYGMEWRVVPGFPLYKISSRGDLLGLRRQGTAGGPVTQKTVNGGYKQVALFDGRRTRTDAMVHRLVLTAFVGPRPEGMVTAHLDGDPTNNQVSNLAWVTQKENMAHREAHGNTLRGFRHPETKFTEAQVAEIRALLPANSIRAVASRFNVHHSTIWRLKVGITFA